MNSRFAAAEIIERPSGTRKRLNIHAFSRSRVRLEADRRKAPPSNTVDAASARLGRPFHPHKSAFTLVEVLIALALTVVLLAAVYGSLTMLWRFESAGRGEVVQGQIARSVFRMMSEDFGSIVFQLPEASSSSSSQAADGSSTSAGTGSGGAAGTSGSSSSIGSASSSTNTTVTTPLTLSGIDETTGVPVTFGLVGDSGIVHLTVSRPSRDLNYDVLNGEELLTGRTSDMQLITWGLAPLPNGYFTPTPGVTVPSRPSQGLGRRALDLYASGIVDAALLEQHLIAGEITQLQFRYYDGAVWVDTWDSQVYGSLPRAIEVTLGFWYEPVKPRGHRGQFYSPGVVVEVRHVISIPMSAPVVESSAGGAT